MARLNASLATAAVSSPSVDSSIYRDRTPDGQPSAGGPRRRVYTTFSPSPGQSDKENYDHEQPTRLDKGKTPVRPLSMPTPTSDELETPRANKRRRLQDRDVSVATTATNAEPIIDLQYYDPDQNPGERRELRRDMRLLSRELIDRRDELLAGNSSELVQMLARSTAYMGRVKQTSDATIDSKFLLGASDLTLKKTTQMVMGDNSTGIDIDEFVSKCITFMQNGGVDGDDASIPTQAASTQARARRQARRNNADSDDEQEDTGDALAWDILGEQACFSNNRRPAVPGFLLGPLSVQKRARATQTQRRARLRHDPRLEKRPESLEPEDIQRAENSNLMTLVHKIKVELGNAIVSRQNAAEDELNNYPGEPSDELIQSTMKKHGVAETDEDPAMSLFEFVINPHSFGQTVENLFYTSFLIRDGYVKIVKDDDGLPLVYPSDSPGLNEQRAQNASRHQAVFSIDYPMWQKLIGAFDLREPVITHRNEEQPTQDVRGWYG